jgi:hypothetical protein
MTSKRITRTENCRIRFSRRSFAGRVSLQSPPSSSGVSSFCSEDRRERRDPRHAPARQRGDEAEPNEQGERLIWHEVAIADRLGAIRGPGESYSGAILRRERVRPMTPDQIAEAQRMAREWKPK